MALDPKFVGRRYGPYEYVVGLEKAREFAFAIHGALPSSLSTGSGAPADLSPLYHSPAAAAAAGAPAVVAFPSFAAVFSIAPFYQALFDPELEINLLMLVHGEQEFEWHRPIYVGDQLSTTGEITHISHRANKDFLTIATSSRDAQGVLVVSGAWTAIIRGA